MEPSFPSSDGHLSTSNKQQNKDGHATLADVHALNGEADQVPLEYCPPTEQQIEGAIQQFIDSVNKDAVCDLASRHNGGKACKIIKKGNGSFNVCFFVRFDAEGKTQVIRIPIEPVVRHAWQKVLSEVATLRYIKDNTTIPIPQVLTYGTHDLTMKLFRVLKRPS